MPETSIEILIRAVDEVSATTKRIEDSIGSMSKEVEKQTKSVSMSFEEQIGIIVSLGSAVASVDRIFDSYSNLQLRLENATERVNGAEDRLAKAQYNLNKVVKSGTATLEDINEAQRDVESSTRSLTIAQNNLERSQNAVLGTYINIGLQLLNLIVAVPKIVSAINAWRQSEQGLNIIRTIGLALTNPIVLGIGLAAAAIAVLTINEMQATASANDLNNSQIGMSTSLQTTNTEIYAQVDAINALSSASQEIVNQNTIWIDSAKKVRDENKVTYDAIMASVQREKDLRLIGKIDEANKEKIIQSELYATYLESQKNFNAKVEEYAKVAFDAQMKRLNDLLTKYTEVITAQNKVFGTGATPGMGAGGGGTIMNMGTKNTIPNYSFNVTKVKDAIVKPNGQIIETDPNDTIYASKNGMGGGIAIYITGNIYGTDPDEIAEALADKLRTKVLI